MSTSDAEARVMKMPNGGFNPACNVQLASDPESRANVGVEVSHEGSDSAGLSEPMREQVEQRSGGKVEQHLLDGGYLRLADIEHAHEQGWNCSRAAEAGPKLASARPRTGTCRATASRFCHVERWSLGGRLRRHRNLSAKSATSETFLASFGVAVELLSQITRTRTGSGFASRWRSGAHFVQRAALRPGTAAISKQAARTKTLYRWRGCKKLGTAPTPTTD